MEPTKVSNISWYRFGMTSLLGLLAGGIVGFLLRLYVRKLARCNVWVEDELIFTELSAKTPLWGLLIGALLGLPFLPFGPKVLLALQKEFGVGTIISAIMFLASITSRMIRLAAEGRSG